MITFPIIAAVALSGCASSLYPFNDSYQTARDANVEQRHCEGKQDLDLVNCQLEAKVIQIDGQHADAINRPELFDLPLLAAAGVASGLLLFDGGATALAATGLAAGVTGTSRTYFNPTAARKALRRGSAGYSCLLRYGRETEGFSYEFLEEPGPTSGAKRNHAYGTRLNVRNQTMALLGSVRASSDNPTNVGLKDKAAATALISQAETAIALFDKQAAAASVADSRLRMAAHHLGLTLIAQTERGPVDFNATIQALVDQAKKTQSFLDESSDAAKGAGGDGDGAGGGARGLRSDADRQGPALRNAIASLLSGMVNLEALVAGYETCTAAALSDAAPPKIEIVFASVKTKSE